MKDRVPRETMEQVKDIQGKPVVEEMALAQSFGRLETPDRI